jgi:hypothetical protein
MRLTEISIRALKGSDKYPTFFCDGTPGFGVRCGLKKKTYVVVRGRHRERITIGTVGNMSLSDARGEAKRLLSATPVAETPQTPSVSFLKARDAFLDTYANPRTRYQVEHALKRNFKPLEALLMCDITHEDIERCLNRLKDRPSEQLHAFRYARALFNWSVKAPRKWTKISPMYGYDPPSTDKKRARILTDAELKAIWDASPPVFRLMILWGTRNTETCVLEREWIVDGAMTIPGKHTKNGRDHAIPICPLAEYVMAGPSNQYVFPGRWEGHLTHHALPKLKNEVMAASGTKDWQIRDIRRTFRSLAARVGVPREIAEVLINHAPPVLDEIYDRYDRIREKREALLKIEHALVWLLARV